MSVTARFVELVSGPESALRLDEAALLVAAHRYPELDVDAELARLDELADGVRVPTLDGLLAHLFGDLGFTGDRERYDDERNAFLNDVVDRRLGLPISLSILAIEVGRRIGVPLAPVSMPGHFLVRDRVDATVFVDPFAGGRVLDAAGAEAIFRVAHGPDARLDPEHLLPATPRAVVARVLANLKLRYAGAGRARDLVWVTRLRAAIPGVPVEERRHLSRALAAVGRFDEAAAELEALAELFPGDDELRHLAIGLRARLS
ncbi:MAG TPA: transglutaminase-like domain-containing protein [Acidimicrobiales bacterium]|nr:transglutaminase-like domain-containing protein [Acidimicrobiales bacterium]